jgi:hypothetical protein
MVYIYTLELYKDPQFLEVPAHPRFRSVPCNISVTSSAYVFGNRQTLSIFASGWTVYQLSLITGTFPITGCPFHGRPIFFSKFQRTKKQKEWVERDISIPSARRSRTSLITSMRLRRVTTGWQPSSTGHPPQGKNMHFEEWLAPQFAQTSLAKNWAG